MQRAGVTQRDAHHAATRLLGGLADRLGHLAGLAVTESDPTFLVADHDQSRKAEALAALHHLRNAIDVNELIDKFAIALVAITASVWITCHDAQSFRLRSAAQRRSAPAAQ